MDLIIHVDGGARGNPGPAGAGVVIRDSDGTLVFEAAYFLGRQTNNTAEYQALIRALQRAHRSLAQSVTVHSDSELLVRQITGEYQVKSPRLAGLHEEVQRLLLRFPRWSVRHVRRAENTRADELANIAMDAQRDRVVFDADEGINNDGPAGPPAPSANETSIQEEPAAATRPAAGADGGEGVRRAIRVTVVKPADASCCPAGEVGGEQFTVESRLPGNLCVHAAHAILPTLLAILNTEPQEFASIPTLTVRCGQAGCGAVFQLAPLPTGNGTRPTV